jgi:hypothetical protein
VRSVFPGFRAGDPYGSEESIDRTGVALVRQQAADDPLPGSAAIVGISVIVCSSNNSDVVTSA